jgi:hypothetical protein
MVGTVEEALALRAAESGACCMGEVRGQAPDAFDYGNSPFEIATVDLSSRPVDFRTETLSVLKTIGDVVPAGIELGYHLCYGSPADEHCVQPKDAGIIGLSGPAWSAAWLSLLNPPP